MIIVARYRTRDGSIAEVESVDDNGFAHGTVDGKRCVWNDYGDVYDHPGDKGLALVERLDWRSKQ